MGRFLPLLLLVFAAQSGYSANPYPTLTMFTPPPSTIQVNQSFTVQTDLLVNGALAEHAGVSISFPSLTAVGASGASYSSSQGSVTTDYVYPGATPIYKQAGDTLYCSSSPTCTAPAQHLLAEADWPSVPAGNYRYFDVTVTPKVVGAFKVRIRAWVTTNAYTDVWRDPTSGYYDQQGWAVYEYTVNVTAPTLYTSLQANPSSGVAPLTTTLSASASGTATGTINYTIWWNCTYAGTSVSSGMASCGSIPIPSAGACASNSIGYKCDGVTNNLLPVNHTFSSAAMYTVKVITERGAASPAEARIEVAVSAPPTLYVSLSAQPTSGTAPLLSSLSASVTGTTTGTINYTFWWNCSNTSTTVAPVMSACGNIPVPTAGFCDSNEVGMKCDGMFANPDVVQHRYAPGGTSTAKVIVERGGLSAQSQATVSVANDTPGPKIGQSSTNILVHATANNSRIHLDTLLEDPWFSDPIYKLIDQSRRDNLKTLPEHLHDGKMPSGPFSATDIRTELFGGDVLEDVDNYWDTTDGIAGVHAQVHAGMIYDYLLKVHDLNGFDAKGGTMRSRVQLPTTDPYYIEQCGSACSDGRAVTYSSEGNVPWSRALDTAAHEWGHMLTRNASASPPRGPGVGLDSEKESGALSEAFSDWMAVAVAEFYGEPSDSIWIYGEGVGAGYLRDVAHPSVSLYSTAINEYLATCSPSGGNNGNDYCCVHTLNGIPNKMFYLLSEGGQHQSTGVKVQGVGVQTAMKLAIDANRYYWVPDTDFYHARLGMISAATDKSYGQNVVDQVMNAWAAVGVGAPAAVLTVHSVSAQTVNVNQTFSVATTVHLGGGLSGDLIAGHAGLSISFPALTAPGASAGAYTSSQGSVTTSSVSSGTTQSYLDVGDSISCASNPCQAQHLLVEGDWSSATSGRSYSLTLAVTPRVAGTFKVRIRGWATGGGYENVWRDPTSGPSDQQGWSVYEYTVTVLDTTAPVISGVGATGITATGATINWTTNEASDSQVEYGTTISYGSSTTLNPSLVTSHSQPLSGLSSGVLYHYRVKSRDAAGNLGTSGDYTFTTTGTTTLAPPTNLLASILQTTGSQTMGSSWSACDLNQDGFVSAADAQLAVNMMNGLLPCTANINGPGVCNIVTVQRVISAALGRACLTDSGASPRAVSLSWTASSSPNVTYSVYRGMTSGGPYTTRVNPAPIIGLSFVDTTVQAGQTYYYVATAVNGSGNESAYSNQAPATIPSP